MIALLEAKRAGMFQRPISCRISSPVWWWGDCLPLAMAFAIASAPSQSRGCTAIIAGLLIAAGGSRVQISGPTGRLLSFCRALPPDTVSMVCRSPR